MSLLFKDYYTLLCPYYSRTTTLYYVLTIQGLLHSTMSLLFKDYYTLLCPYYSRTTTLYYVLTIQGLQHYCPYYSRTTTLYYVLTIQGLLHYCPYYSRTTTLYYVLTIQGLLHYCPYYSRTTALSIMITEHVPSCVQSLLQEVVDRQHSLLESGGEAPVDPSHLLGPLSAKQERLFQVQCSWLCFF